MNWLTELVVENPMLIEIRRYRRKMLSTRGGGSNIAVVVLILLFYALIVLMIVSNARDVDPVWIVWGQTGMFMFLLPVMAAGAIAGERERRTWEILLTAPISKAQIIAGKFIAIVAGTGIFFLACALPAIACVIANRTPRFASTVSAELVSASFAMLLVALSLYVSSRSRTTFAAVGACIGLVFVVYGAVPIFLENVLGKAGSDFLGVTDPFYVINKLTEGSGVIYYTTSGNHATSFDHSRWSISVLHAVAYSALTALLLTATTLTVRKMEEIKDFMPEPNATPGKAHA